MIVLRSLIFNLVFFGWTTVFCLSLLWTLLLPRWVLVACVTWYMGSIAFLERTILNLRYEVRGQEHLLQGCFILAAKHQSMWETMKLHLLLPDPAVVMKRELYWLPVWGWYAAKARSLAVDRGARGRAIPSLLAGGEARKAEGRPIVIFPQGTRVTPGTWVPYRVGVGLLYERLGVPIVPMAVNSGLFWPRRSFLKRPGTITIEFLPPILPGRGRAAAMAELTERLEAATDRLVVAAGGPATVRS